MSFLEHALDTVEDELTFFTTALAPTDDSFPTFPISVKCLTGQTWNFHVSADMTGGSLKSLIQDQTDIPFDQQRLIISGRRLHDDALLGNSGVSAGSLVYLTLWLRGGEYFIRCDARNIVAVALWDWNGTIPNEPGKGLALRKGQEIRIIGTQEGSAWCAGIHENSPRTDFKHLPLAYVEIPSISQTSITQSSRWFPWSSSGRPSLPPFDWQANHSMPYTITDRFIYRTRIRVGVSLSSDNHVSAILSLIPEPRARFSSATLKVDLAGCIIVGIESSACGTGGETYGKIVGDGVGSSLAYWVISEDTGRRNGLEPQFKLSVLLNKRPSFVECSVEATVVCGDGAEARWYNSKTHKCGPNKVML